MSIDFSLLSPPQIIEELNFEAVLAERKSALIDKYDGDEQLQIIATLERESEPLTKLLEENAYRELILRQRINQAARAVLLAFASGSDLDHVAANFNTQRLVISPANNSVYPPLPAVYESDDVLRQRALLAFDALSVAGPKQAYIYHALSADGRVADATAISPAPAEALITVLQLDSEDGSTSQDLLNIVDAALSDQNIRPVGDRVTVQSAEIIEYEIEARLYVNRVAEHSTLVEEAIKRVQKFAHEPRRLGRCTYLSQLYALLTVDGVVRAEILQPTADVPVNDQQATYCSNIRVEIGGVV